MAQVSLKYLLLLSLFIGLQGCQLTQQETEQQRARPEIFSHYEPDLTTQQAPSEFVDSTAVEPRPIAAPIAVNNTPLAKPRSKDLWQHIANNLTLVFQTNKHTSARVKWYLKQPNYLIKVNKRAAPYLYHIVTRIEQQKLPMELALLPFVESDFRPTIRSSEQAVGVWQLVGATAYHFGVQSDQWYDGRQDILASTDAALAYLSYLHKRFDGDWYHAIAAYNLGEGRVLRAISNNKKQGKPTDFFSLKLPKQTSQYVPKLLAAAQLLKRNKMVFPPTSNQQTIVALPVSGAVILDNQEEWRSLEGLNYGVIRFPAVIDAPHIVVPASKQAEFKSMLANQKENDYSQWQHYTIQPGDSLSVIAKRYAISVKQLKAFNNLKTDRIRAGKKLILPMLADQQVEHLVKSGESLWKIAKRYNVSITKLKQWNNLSRDRLQIGEKLTVFLSNS